MPSCATNSSTRHFAGDSLLYRCISTPVDCALLQQDLDALVDWERRWLMKFSATKCQVLQITNKQKPTLGSYIIQDSKLNFNADVDAVTKKASATRAFLCRYLSHCNPKIKETSYKTCVRPVIEYSAAAWDPHTQGNIDKLEMVQHSLARFVTCNFDRRASVTAMLQDFKWPSLATRHRCSRLELMFCIRFGLIDIDWSNCLVPSTSSTRGHPSQFLCHHRKSDVYLNSFLPRTTMILQLSQPSMLPSKQHWGWSCPNYHLHHRFYSHHVYILLLWNFMWLSFFFSHHIWATRTVCLSMSSCGLCIIMEGRKLAKSEAGCRAVLVTTSAKVFWIKK